MAGLNRALCPISTVDIKKISSNDGPRSRSGERIDPITSEWSHFEAARIAEFNGTASNSGEERFNIEMIIDGEEADCDEM
jgi:hypothetical protein